MTADTTSEVSHRRAEQPEGAWRGSAVSNSAADVNSVTPKGARYSRDGNAPAATRPMTTRLRGASRDHRSRRWRLLRRLRE